MLADSLNSSCFTSAIQLCFPNVTSSKDILMEGNFSLFQCGICDTFVSASVELLTQHVFLNRTWLPQKEFVGAEDGTFVCKICTFETKENRCYYAHCNSIRHRLNLQYASHVKEGGSRADWKLKDWKAKNTFLCNACKHSADSMFGLVLHTQNPSHVANEKLFLERSESAVRTRMKTYHCSVCNVSVGFEENIVQHSISPSHIEAKKLRQLQGESAIHLKEFFIVGECEQISPKSRSIANEMKNKSGIGDSVIQVSRKGDTNEDEKSFMLSDATKLNIELNDKLASSTPGSLPLTCPFCNYLYKSDNVLQIHVIDEHYELKNTLSCMWPKDTLTDRLKLENRMNINDRSKENANKQINLISKTVIKNHKNNLSDCNKRSTEESKFNTRGNKENTRRSKIENTISVGRKGNHRRLQVRPTNIKILGNTTKDDLNRYTVINVPQDTDKLLNNIQNVLKSNDDLHASTSFGAFDITSDVLRTQFQTISCSTSAFRNVVVPVSHANDTIPFLTPHIFDVNSSVRDKCGFVMPKRSSNKRNSCTQFSDYQTKVLMKFLKSKAYPKKFEYQSLSKQLNLNLTVIKSWFAQHRRCIPVHLRRNPRASLIDISPDQQNYLKEQFKISESPTLDILNEIALNTRLHLKTVKKWFMCTRYEFGRKACGSSLSNHCFDEHEVCKIHSFLESQLESCQDVQLNINNYE